MKKKGFTLVEVIAVIAILGLLVTMVTPKVMSNYRNKKNTLYENTVKEIEKVSSMYLTNNPDLYGKISDDGFTNISINSLCIDNLINCPVIDPRDDSEINGYVKVSYMDNKYEYEFVNEEYINENVNLTVELNGGSITNNIEGTYSEGEFIEIDMPKKEGSAFVKWEVVKGNSVINNNKLTIGSTDTILYAVWESGSSLIIDLDGGVSSTDQSAIYKSGTIIKLVEPTRENYIFVGWEELEGNGILSGNTYIIGTEYAVLKALWKLKTFSLTVELNGGTSVQEFKNEYAIGETVTLKVPTRTGYSFTNWTATNGNVDDNTFTMGNGDAILTANWEVNTYNIGYELDGGISGSNAPTSGIYGSTVEISNPERTGYIFKGWTVSGTGALISGTSLTIGASDIILTANWEATIHNISIEAATGGSVAVESLTASNGKTVTLTVTLTTPTTSVHYAYDGATISYTENGIAKSMELAGNIKEFTMPASDVVITPKFSTRSIVIDTYVQYSVTTGGSWVKVFYCASYDPISNITTVVLHPGTYAQRLFTQGYYVSSTSITVTAIDSGDSGSSSSYVSGTNNSGGRIWQSPAPDPAVIYLQHANVVGEKSFSISANTSYTGGGGSGSATHTVGTYNG